LTNITKGTHPVLKAIDGAVAPTAESNAGGESLLDLSISMPLIYPQKVWLYQTDDTPYENNYNYSGFLNNFFGESILDPDDLVNKANCDKMVSTVPTASSVTSARLVIARKLHLSSSSLAMY